MKPKNLSVAGMCEAERNELVEALRGFIKAEEMRIRFPEIRADIDSTTGIPLDICAYIENARDLLARIDGGAK